MPCCLRRSFSFTRLFTRCAEATSLRGSGCLPWAACVRRDLLFLTHTPANFDRIARLYRWAEYLGYGPLLQRVRTHFLPDLLTCRQALVLGDGDGRFLARFLHANRSARVLAVDTSAEMLRLLRERCLAFRDVGQERLHTRQASLLDVPPAKDTDLVVSHFVLDCLSDGELRALTQRLAAELSPGARWLVSDFDVPASRWLRTLARWYLRSLYAAFRMLTGLRITHLPAVSEALQAGGFVRIGRAEFAAGMLYTEVWQLGGPKSSQPEDRTLPQASMEMRSTMGHPAAQDIQHHTQPDPQPDPEPPVPSMPEPDRGVFQHRPVASAQSCAPRTLPGEEYTSA